MEIATVIAVACACGAGGLAWGYRGQRDQEREQIVYLRAQLREARGLPPLETVEVHKKSNGLAAFGVGR